MNTAYRVSRLHSKRSRGKGTSEMPQILVRTTLWSQLLLLAAGWASTGCKREERGFRVSPSQADLVQRVDVSGLHPGGSNSNSPVRNDYEGNAQALSEGKQLYQQMNCVGCHAHGGGGMGPALMDEKW